MNQECVPLAPNTGVAPNEAYGNGDFILLILAIFVLAGLALAIIYKKRLSKLFAFFLAPVFVIGTLSFGGLSSTVGAQACGVSSTPAPMAITAENDIFQSDLPSSANGNNGNNLLKAFVTSMYGSDDLLYTFDYSAYYATYADGSAQLTAPSITIKLLNNDTTASNLQLDPQSVDLDPVTAGIQQVATIGAYQLEYMPLVDELKITIIDAQQALEEIIPDTFSVGMPLSEFTPIANRPVTNRSIVKNFSYSVKDTTGAHSATAKAVITIVGEASAAPFPL